jgi:hypothetical protein
VLRPAAPSLLASTHTVVDVGPASAPRLISCVRSAQGFDWNQDMFLPAGGRYGLFGHGHGHGYGNDNDDDEYGDDDDGYGYDEENEREEGDYYAGGGSYGAGYGADEYGGYGGEEGPGVVRVAEIRLGDEEARGLLPE